MKLLFVLLLATSCFAINPASSWTSIKVRDSLTFPTLNYVDNRIPSIADLENQTLHIANTQEGCLLQRADTIELFWQHFGGTVWDSLYYQYATDSVGSSYSEPVNANLKIRFPLVIKNAGTYYAFGGTAASTGSIYMWSSTNRTTWTQLNGGNPVLTQTSGNYANIANVAVVIVDTTWHMFIESWTTAGYQTVGIYYSYSTLAEMNWDTRRTANPIIPGGAASRCAIHVADRNAVVVFPITFPDGPNEDGDFTAAGNSAYYCLLSDNMSVDTDWHLAPRFWIFEKGMFDGNVGFLSGTGKTHNIIMVYSHNESNQLAQCYLDMTLNQFYDTITSPLVLTRPNLYNPYISTGRVDSLFAVKILSTNLQIYQKGSVGGIETPSDVFDVRMRLTKNQEGITISAPNNNSWGSSPALTFKRYNGDTLFGQSRIYADEAHAGTRGGTLWFSTTEDSAAPAVMSDRMALKNDGTVTICNVPGNQTGLTIIAPKTSGNGSQPAIVFVREDSATGIENTRAVVYGSGDSGSSIIIATAHDTAKTSPQERLIVLGNGKVGIGVHNPTVALDVSGKINTTDTIKARAIDLSPSGGLFTLGSSQINRTDGLVELQYNGGGNNGVRFFGNTAHSVTFKSGGNVDITDTVKAATTKIVGRAISGSCSTAAVLTAKLTYTSYTIYADSAAAYGAGVRAGDIYFVGDGQVKLMY